MNIYSISYTLTSFFYLWALTHIYFSFLTPKQNLPCPRMLCCLLLSPMIILTMIQHYYLRISVWLIMLFPLFLFLDSWRRRLACYVTAYLIMLLNECICYSFAYMIAFSIIRKDYQGLAPIDSMPLAVLPTALLTIFTGIPLVLILVHYGKGWFCYVKTTTLLMIGLPLVLCIIQEVPIFSGSILYIFTVPLYLLCTLSLVTGFRRMHRQELLRNQHEHQYELVREQLSYLQKLETEYRELRRWNHDIDNHFLALSNLLRKKQYLQASRYIQSLLKNL